MLHSLDFDCNLVDSSRSIASSPVILYVDSILLQRVIISSLVIFIPSALANEVIGRQRSALRNGNEWLIEIMMD